MLNEIFKAIIEFINQYYGVIVFLINALGSGYKAYRHIKNERKVRKAPLKPDHRPYVRSKMTASHSKYRRRPRRSRRSRSRKKA